MTNKELEKIADQKVIGFAQNHSQVIEVTKIDEGFKITYYFQHNPPYDFDLGDHLCRQEINIHRRTGLYIELIQCPPDFLDSRTPAIYTKAA